MTSAPILYYAAPPNLNRFAGAAVLMFVWAGLLFAVGICLMFCGVVVGLYVAVFEGWWLSVALILLPYLGIGMVLWGSNSADCGICLWKGQRTSLRGPRWVAAVLEWLAYGGMVCFLVWGSWQGSAWPLESLVAVMVLIGALAALMTVTRVSLGKGVAPTL